jgi:hypothetical protein
MKCIPQIATLPIAIRPWHQHRTYEHWIPSPSPPLQIDPKLFAKANGQIGSNNNGNEVGQDDSGEVIVDGTHCN